MASSSVPWPCPACAGLLSDTMEDCPHCRLPAGWVDLLLALGYAVRQFHFWSVIGSLDKPTYRGIVEAVRRRQDEMTRAGQADQPVFAGTGLPERTVCWRCQKPCGPAARICSQCGGPLTTPEVRLIRYQTFLCQEIRNHAQAGLLSPALANQFLAEIGQSIDELKKRVAK